LTVPDSLAKRKTIPLSPRNQSVLSGLNPIGGSLSSAFVCADLAMGGHLNLIPLDETIDAVLAVGRMLPPELRVTSRGGLAITPSALKLHRRQ
jgi:hypothetical protein